MTFAPESSVHPVVSARRPVIPRARAAGKAGVLMAGLVVRESVTLAGRAGGRSGRGPPVPSSLRCSARGTRAGTWLSCWSARSSVILSGTPARVLPGRRSRSRSGLGAASSGSRSLTGPGRGRQTCGLRAATPKAAGGFSSSRASRRGGAGGDGAAGGWSPGSSCRTPADVSARRLAADVLWHAPKTGERVGVFPRCGAGCRGRLPSHVHRWSRD